MRLIAADFIYSELIFDTFCRAIAAAQTVSDFATIIMVLPSTPIGSP